MIDLNADVVALRRLRAAAVLPQFLALCCAMVAFFYYAFDGNTTAALSLVGSGALLILLGRSVERGNRWAVWLLATLVLAATGLFIGSIVVTEASLSERAQVAGGSVLMLTPCWILVSLGWRAHRNPGAVSAVRAVTHSASSRIPREHRSRKAFESFGIALIIYVAGLVPAALAALAVGGHLWLAALVYWPIAVLGGRMWSRGRRESALGVREIRKLDTRPSVLLLRSFADDNLPLGQRYHFLWFLFAAKESLTLEGFVVDQVWRLGPVVAIGNPRERLHPLGAAREYVPEDRWRARIHEYLSESAYVISILGDTPGLSWEYQQIQTSGKDNRMLVVFPPRDVEELQRRWKALQTILGRAKAVELQWQPFIGAPLVAWFAADAVIVFYCKYQHETAYAAAFSRLFEMTRSSSR